VYFQRCVELSFTNFTALTASPAPGWRFSAGGDVTFSWLSAEQTLASRVLRCQDHARCEEPMVKLTVNGTSRSFDGDDDMPLLWYLRDELRLTGTRFGCGAGLCGACTVHVDGQAVRACQTQMSALQDKRVTTIEGLSPNGTHPVQRAWEQHNVVQCGYCQPGQIMQAAAMLQQTPKPTDADIDRVMAGNICRCGTYQRIRAAIKAAANGGRS
jgi:isoquinoline 1-oxidoreductase subunit alpha